MAEGAGAISGDSLESSLEKRFQNVTNTMDSIQGLSTWCVDNKKYHSLIVRHWIKCMKKCEYLGVIVGVQTRLYCECLRPHKRVCPCCLILGVSEVCAKLWFITERRHLQYSYIILIVFLM